MIDMVSMTHIHCHYLDSCSEEGQDEMDIQTEDLQVQDNFQVGQEDTRNKKSFLINTTMAIRSSPWNKESDGFPKILGKFFEPFWSKLQIIMNNKNQVIE